MNSKPYLIVTIDTEGDNLWSKPKLVSTKNAQFLFRFQEICEKYLLKPTYLTNYEMANSKQFQELGKDIINRKYGEIGMHLHAWDSPPKFSLTDNDYQFQPYLIEYPKNIMREKIKVMTNLLEDQFAVKIISHRAGRWSFNETYARILIEHGYKVDCSVTPHVSWKNDIGDPTQEGGTDYRKYPSNAYFMDISNISKSGNSTLLEVPVTIKCKNFLINQLRAKYGNILYVKKALNYFSPLIWIRPNLRNTSQILDFLTDLIDEKRDYVMFMLHSAELMPAGSPTFSTEFSIEKLYDKLTEIFEFAKSKFIGCTLSEYHNKFTKRAVIETSL